MSTNNYEAVYKTEKTDDGSITTFEKIQSVNDVTTDQIEIDDSRENFKFKFKKLKQIIKIGLAGFFLIVVFAVVGICIIWKIETQAYQEFDKYFSSKAKVIHQSVPLKTQYSPVTWPEFGKLDLVDVTVIFQTSGRTQLLALTLSSFFTFNTYPVKKILAVHDGETSPGLDQVISRYPNITWLITNFRVGQLTAIDQVYKYIETEYYFHSQDDWQYLQSGFIEYCIQALNFDERLSGLHLHHQVNYAYKPFVSGPLQIITEFHLVAYSGFSFHPSVHRIKDYQHFKHGYTGATFNMSFAKGVGSCESFISIQYSTLDFHYAMSSLVFVRNVGRKQPSPVKFEVTQTYTGFKNWVVNKYSYWFSKHNDMQKQKKELSYLSEKHKKLGLPQISVDNVTNQTSSLQNVIKSF